MIGTISSGQTVRIHFSKKDKNQSKRINGPRTWRTRNATEVIISTGKREKSKTTSRSRESIGPTACCAWLRAESFSGVQTVLRCVNYQDKNYLNLSCLRSGYFERSKYLFSILRNMSYRLEKIHFSGHFFANRKKQDGIGIYFRYREVCQTSLKKYEISEK